MENEIILKFECPIKKYYELLRLGMEAETLYYQNKVGLTRKVKIVGFRDCHIITHDFFKSTISGFIELKEDC